jgi:hypothetical protein
MDERSEAPERAGGTGAGGRHRSGRAAPERAGVSPGARDFK